MIQPWHWALLAVFGGAFGIKDREDFLRVALFVLAGFISILIHELGHALTGKKYGARPQIVLHGMGGYAAFPNGRFTRNQSFLVTAAGPAIQIALGLFAWAILKYGSLPETEIRTFFSYLYLVSIFWALINLIPVSPLDGGQMLQSILGPSRRTLSLQISIVTAIIAAVAMYHFFKSIIFPILLLYLAYQNYKLLKPTPKDFR